MKSAKWIRSPKNMDTAVVSFSKQIKINAPVCHAEMRASAVGVYIVSINGKKVGDRVLAPGFTAYKSRVLYQTYDVTDMLGDLNDVVISVGSGWATGALGYTSKRNLFADHVRAALEIELTYTDGRTEIIAADGDWDTYTHPVTFAEIYNGETIDKSLVPQLIGKAVVDDDEYPLVADDGAPVREHEILAPVEYIVTPKGERVIDFGQNMTGYVTLKIKGKRGERVVFDCAEVLDKDGNFYNENYRTAKNLMTYILSGEEDFFKPEFSFQGFRYIRIEEYPDMDMDLDGFRAVAVHTDMKRTGDFVCGDSKINQLYHNIIWGQKSNYLDVPTDCPQRDERLGWTGDAQVFCRTAAINYDVLAFFRKWLGDLRTDQGENGEIWGVCPEIEGMHKRKHSRISCGWGDVVTIAPWTLYELYGDKQILADNFEMMRKWVEYMHSAGDEEYLWLSGYHYGDWLAMDAGEDSYVGATANDLVATAFFAYSTELLVKAGKVLGKDMSYYEDMHSKIVAAFREYFMENGMPKDEFPMTEILPEGAKQVDTTRKGMTQTALVLILHFGLCTVEERPALTQKLVELIKAFGGKMTTGFLGTPYILHALADNGRVDEAYKLLFAEENPSWLYSVNHGATTMWEHWNGIKEDGSFWSTAMNSFNHYAYGAVGDWLYGVVAGVKITEPAYAAVKLEPKPCERLGFVRCAIDTPQGKLESNWYYTGEHIRFEFSVPKTTTAQIVLPNGYTTAVSGGTYHFEIAK